MVYFKKNILQSPTFIYSWNHSVIKAGKELQDHQAQPLPESHCGHAAMSQSVCRDQSKDWGFSLPWPCLHVHIWVFFGADYKENIL